jgi:hypothetical protein
MVKYYSSYVEAYNLVLRLCKTTLDKVREDSDHPSAVKLKETILRYIHHPEKELSEPLIKVESMKKLPFKVENPFKISIPAKRCANESETVTVNDVDEIDVIFTSEDELDSL